MNIHLTAILGFTRYQGFDPSPTQSLLVTQHLAASPFRIRQEAVMNKKWTWPEIHEMVQQILGTISLGITFDFDLAVF